MAFEKYAFSDFVIFDRLRNTIIVKGKHFFVQKLQTI